MTIDDAIRILDPKTTAEALAEVEYYGGFSGQEAVIKAVEDACRIAIAAMERTRWIPCSEKLPDAFVSVLVEMPGEEPFPIVREGYISDDGTWVAGNFKREPGEITRWRPMPAPPKGGDGE